MTGYLRPLVLAALCAAPLALGLQAQQAPAPPAAPPAQQPAQPSPPDPAAQTPPAPIFRTDINFVRVDVIVSDKQGNAVADLRQQDFEVTEDGKAQAVQTFKLSTQQFIIGASHSSCKCRVGFHHDLGPE